MSPWLVLMVAVNGLLVARGLRRVVRREADVLGGGLAGSWCTCSRLPRRSPTGRRTATRSRASAVGGRGGRRRAGGRRCRRRRRAGRQSTTTPPTMTSDRDDDRGDLLVAAPLGGCARRGAPAGARSAPAPAVAPASRCPPPCLLLVPARDRARGRAGPRARSVAQSRRCTRDTRSRLAGAAGRLDVPSRRPSPTASKGRSCSITGFPAAAFGTNCYVVAPGAGRGVRGRRPRDRGASTSSTRCSREHRLQPVAVLLTHGHLDHIFSVTPVCGARDIPAYIHPDDDAHARRPDGRALARDRGRCSAAGCEWTEPDDVQPLADGERARARRAGAHRRPRARAHPRVGARSGCRPTTERARGDALAATCCSPARSGAPTCRAATTPRCCAAWPRKVLPLRDDVVVLPGHGPQTTIGRERATNPFLQDLARRRAAGPDRGL